ncbi:transcriptional regulator [Prauserella sp. PE36]|uniref:helix-turn-helix domain-containing protein n=1 Tax=Prauserella sp. PE36 TaxID=1504709 RepID=UPI000DE25D45|nr:helix-turn-helix transcriptional regulator [Prauserella sp. PE36]RBM10579.1 transcriptional regulator [Prauserella sp. PE36]
MTEAADLGSFLKARRAALDPRDLGLPEGATRRRVAGLRREELAQLAGMSVDYYTRLEQGRARNVSDAVLDALARALRLTADETTYLRNLARSQRRRPVRRPQRVRPEILQLLDAMRGVPAMVFGRRCDVLAWNALGGAIAFDFASVPPQERNVARLFFLEEATARGLHPEWEQLAEEVVGNLRAAAGHDPDDPELARLVGELSAHSAVFRGLWNSHSVQEKANGVKRIRNPVAGDLVLRYETLLLPDDPTQALITYTAEPGSESERNLRLLASWVAERPAQAALRAAGG